MEEPRPRSATYLLVLSLGKRPIHSFPLFSPAGLSLSLKPASSFSPILSLPSSPSRPSGPFSIQPPLSLFRCLFLSFFSPWAGLQFLLSQSAFPFFPAPNSAFLIFQPHPMPMIVSQLGPQPFFFFFLVSTPVLFPEEPKTDALLAFHLHAQSFHSFSLLLHYLSFPSSSLGQFYGSLI